MPIMAWRDTYSTGIAEVDRQHRQLIALINSLNDAMAAGQGKAVLGKILGELIDYCATHFAMEERLFDQHGYPEADEHKDKHRKMTVRVIDLQEQFKQGKAMLTLEVMEFLQQWLDKHILGTDQKYVPFLTGKGVR